MSGIAGLIHLDGRPADGAIPRSMAQSLVHRGPDASEIHVDGPVGFAHCLLRTTPESLHESLPLADPGGDLLLTADARIDNRAGLLRDLGLEGRPGAVIPDSALILKAYETWGEECPARLLGDFAFAIWDRRKQQMFAARDHLGVRPFFYHHRPGRLFAFGSEIKALLRVPEVPRRLNEVRVADYLVPMLEDKVITFYRDIVRLPPAHTLTVGRDGMAVRSYWSLDPSRELRLGSDEEYAAAFRDLFSEAVRCRLRSAGPIGSLLSGGIDSSSIVCVARSLLEGTGGAPLHTFSALFDEVPECDERPFINAVLEGGGVEPHFVRADLVSPFVDLDRVFDHEDEPFYAMNLFMHWALYRAARDSGVRVLLDGIDGDTTLAQRTEFLAELVRAGRWRSLAAEIRGLSARLGLPPRTLLWKYALRPAAPEALRRAWRRARGRHRPPWSRNRIINPAFSRRIGLARRAEGLLADRLRPARTSREDHWRRLNSGLVPFVLEVADKAAAAFGLEPRYPFFDRRLVEFCLALPVGQKLRHGWTRAVLRRALAGVLPDAIRCRGGKTDLNPLFNRGLRIFEQERLEDVIVRNPGRLEEHVDVPALRETYHRFVRAGAEEDAHIVWVAATLGLWLRHAELTHQVV